MQLEFLQDERTDSKQLRPEAISFRTGALHQIRLDKKSQQPVCRAGCQAGARNQILESKLPFALSYALQQPQHSSSSAVRLVRNLLHAGLHHGMSPLRKSRRW